MPSSINKQPARISSSHGRTGGRPLAERDVPYPGWCREENPMLLVACARKPVSSKDSNYQCGRSAIKCSLISGRRWRRRWRRWPLPSPSPPSPPLPSQPSSSPPSPPPLLQQQQQQRRRRRRRRRQPLVSKGLSAGGGETKHVFGWRHDRHPIIHTGEVAAMDARIKEAAKCDGSFFVPWTSSLWKGKTGTYCRTVLCCTGRCWAQCSLGRWQYLAVSMGSIQTTV